MVTVGIGPHKHVRVAVAVDTDGRPIGKTLTARDIGGWLRAAPHRPGAPARPLLGAIDALTSLVRGTQAGDNAMIAHGRATLRQLQRGD